MALGQRCLLACCWLAVLISGCAHSPRLCRRLGGRGPGADMVCFTRMGESRTARSISGGAGATPGVSVVVVNSGASPRGERWVAQVRSEWLAREGARLRIAQFWAIPVLAVAPIASLSGLWDLPIIGGLLAVLTRWAPPVVWRGVTYRAVKREGSGWVEGHLSTESSGGRYTPRYSGVLLCGGHRRKFSHVRAGTRLIPEEWEHVEVIVPANWTTRSEFYVISRTGQAFRLRR